MKLLSILALCLLASCSPETPGHPDGLFVPNKPIIAADAWAYDAAGSRYGSDAARKIRFRDAWMSFHNYFSPADVRANTGGFETWFAATPTSNVKDGDEYQFTLDLFR